MIQNIVYFLQLQTYNRMFLGLFQHMSQGCSHTGLRAALTHVWGAVLAHVSGLFSDMSQGCSHTCDCAVLTHVSGLFSHMSQGCSHTSLRAVLTHVTELFSYMSQGCSHTCTCCLSFFFSVRSMYYIRVLPLVHDAKFGSLPM